MRRALALLVLLLPLAAPSDARAHPLGFAVVAIDETSAGSLDVVVRISGTESDPGHIAITWPAGCEERVRGDAMHDEVRERRSRVTCASALAGATLTLDGPARGLEVRLEARLRGAPEAISVVRALPAQIGLGARTGTMERIVAQARLGATHFALGIDHVLFVVGAFFLARRRGARAVAAAVTAFTVGHAITLALASMGAWTVPTRPVEACIALSLVHVARELRVEADTLTRRAPALACGLFGLVHGAGLASVMSGAGLSGVDLAVTVGSFNLGLELAELALVVALFVLLRGALSTRAEKLGPLVVGGVGAWLLLERLV